MKNIVGASLDTLDGCLKWETRWSAEDELVLTL